MAENILEEIGTDLKNDFSSVASAISSAFKNTPVAADVTQTLQKAEAAVPQLADTGLTAAMATLGPEGVAFTPLAISFLNALIAGAQAKVAALTATAAKAA